MLVGAPAKIRNVKLVRVTDGTNRLAYVETCGPNILVEVTWLRSSRLDVLAEIGWPRSVGWHICYSLLYPAELTCLRSLGWNVLFEIAWMESLDVDHLFDDLALLPLQNARRKACH